MELCLYDKAHGYYTSNIRDIGSSGDFSTSATLFPHLGRALAAWILEDTAGHKQLIELGAGTGELARITQNALRRQFSFTPWERIRRIGSRPLRYNIVESSPTLRTLQRKSLGRRARWHDGIAEALLRAGGKALIFSNELVDAFPVRVFRNDSPWSELFLSLEHGTILERWQPAGPLPDSTVFSHSWDRGQVVEVHESYHHWLQDWLKDWHEGQLLTIDYGGSAPDIYHRRPAGSRRAYYHHERLTGSDLYRLPGRQDLTADVNFEDLTAWGEQLGLRRVALDLQEKWLAPFCPDPASAQVLTSPERAGQAFKVLLQERIPKRPNPGISGLGSH